MGLGCGLPEGQSSALLKTGAFLCSHSWVILALWAGAESCWKTPAWPLKRVVLRGFTTPYSTSSWYTWAPHQFSHLSRKKMKRCHPLMGHPPPPNHDVGWLYCSSMVKIFLSVKRMFSYPFSVCHWRSHCVFVCRISFKARMRRCPFNCQYAVMCRSSLIRCDINRADMFSSRDMIFCFRSGSHSHTVLRAVSVLTLLGCPDQALFSTLQSSL